MVRAFCESMTSNIDEKREISRIEQRINELIDFYNNVYKNNEDGYFHFTTAKNLIGFKEKNSELRGFIEKNIYFLIGLERLKEISELENKIIFLEKQEVRKIEKDIQNKYNRDYYPVCYLLKDNEKKLVVASYEKSLQEGGPEIFVSDEVI
jgi:hypothetical protein